MKYTHTETNLPIENQYPKLVRDCIPEIVERDGRTVKMHVADDAEYVQFLLTKLIEEATELQEATDEKHQKEELADVREVVRSIQAALHFDEADIAEVQTSKRDERGGFGGKIIFDSLPE